MFIIVKVYILETGDYMLKAIRTNKGYSQSELAEISSVNIRMIQHYEQGYKDINNAKLDTLLSLSIALECGVSDLLTSEDLKNKCGRAKL